MKRIALMFPGQGSQSVGMGKELYDEYSSVQALYARANESLDKDLTSIMFNGSEELLTETENAQPALLLSSVAAYSLLIHEGVKPTMAIGHSLGEYSGLVAAHALSLEKALPLVSTRGKLMEEAFPRGQGSMAAVLGLTEEKITQTLKQLNDEEVVDIANINCPGQIVISGSKAGLEKAASLLKEKGAKRVIFLNVSGPFHSRLMKRANEQFSKHIDNVLLKDADIPVYANVSAKPVTDHNEIKELLVKQLYSPVRFEQSIREMMQTGVDAFVEVGNGRVLSGLVRKINRKAKTFSVQDQTSLEKFLQWYKED